MSKYYTQPAPTLFGHLTQYKQEFLTSQSEGLKRVRQWIQKESKGSLKRERVGLPPFLN